MIEAIFFDGDQTLWDFDAVMRRALAATLDELRTYWPDTADRIDIETLIADRDVVAATMQSQGASLDQIRVAAIAYTLERHGLVDENLSQYLGAFYLDRRRSDVELYDDTVPVLTTLRRRHKVGLLTNGNSRPPGFGLAHLFSAMVFADDQGVAKPDRRIYEIAAGEAGCLNGLCVMVGDSLVNDVAGAQDAGWIGIWLNRDGAALDHGIRPDAEIASLYQLPGVLESLDA